MHAGPARNKAAELATSEVVSFINADDEMYEAISNIPTDDAEMANNVIAIVIMNLRP